MDFKSSLKFIAENYVLVTGSTLALFFATSMVLLIRSIGKKNDEAQAAPPLDVKEIEDAMQRVLAANPIPVAAAPAPAVIEAEISEEKTQAVPQPAPEANQNLEVIEAYKNKVNDLEGQIEQLKRELEQARAKERSRSENSVSKEDYDALQEKVTELQARLAEYEIIEDDIADLSMYKEENARLKAEITRLKGGDPNAQEGATEPPEPQVVKPAPKPNRFELDVNDQIMKEFATAIEIRNAPPAEAQATLPNDLINENLAAELQSQGAAPTQAGDAGVQASGSGGSGQTSDEDAKVDEIAQEVETAIAAEAALQEAEAAQAAEGAETPETAQATDELSQLMESAAAPEAPQVAEENAVADAAVAETEASAETDKILSEALEADKILNEMASLEGKEGGDLGDVLSDSLDTDKLLEEMNSLIADPNAGESQNTQKKAGTG